MAKVDGISEIVNALGKAKSRIGSTQKVSVIVGYTQSYAIYVHENLEAHHPVGQAKYLESPYRRMKPELVKAIQLGASKGLSLLQTIMRAGLLLQRESQKQVPVDTGALKNSAFTKQE